MIEVRHLTRRFDGLTAVEDLSLDVGPGEIVALLGPNGAGKTTTLRMLAALIPPTTGDATICGHRLGEDDDAVRRSIGLLTEVPGLYDRLSSRANLELHARLHGVRDAAGCAERYLELLGLAERRNDPAGSLSKGMRQKLALARALLHEPKVLLLDEPTAGLDPRMARIVRDSIMARRDEGRAILLSTHNLAEAERLADRVALLRRRLVALESPAALRERLSGSRTVVRLARPNAAAVGEVVRKLPFVSAVEADGDRLVVALDGSGSTPPLVRALVEAGAEVLEISPLRRSLEDVYLELMPPEEA